MQRKHCFSNLSVNETSWIEKICGKESSAENAIPHIISEIEAKPLYYKYVRQIRCELFSTMKEFYKDQVLDVKPFGSAVTTLALDKSDVDIFVDFGEKLPNSPKPLLRALKNKIKKNKKFHKTMPISARVPIVQCKHISGLSCDISFLNGLGVSNSNLIKFLIETDDRIRPLILIIKYILKKKELVSPSSFSSYAVVVLVIFFLQQLKNPLLPTVSHLQNLSSEKKKIALWETAFVTDLTLLSPTTNKSSVPVLLKQFFEFYSTFEFGLYVISCFTGKTYLKPFFDNTDLLPEEYECYKKNVKENSDLKFECNKYMCVQGLFNHSHNITRIITPQILEKFQNFCFESTKICRENMEEGGKSSSMLFKSLFLNAMRRDEENYKKLKPSEGIIHVPIYIGIGISLSNHNSTEEDLRNNWSNSTVARVKDILVKIMKCTVDEYPLDNSCDKFNFLINGKTLKVFRCDFHNFDLVTKIRKKAKLEMKFPKNMNLINQEELVSDFLCDTWLKNTPKISLKFAVVCTLNTNPTHLQLTLICEEQLKAKKNSLNPVFQFIKNCVPKYFT